MNDRNDRGPLASLAGLGLVLLGVIFLAQQFAGDRLPIVSWTLLWPLFVIVPGLAFFAAMIQSGKSAGGLAIPGSIITITGLLLFYQNVTHHWQSWAYAWALIAPMGVGVGLLIRGGWTGSPVGTQAGSRLFAIGLTLFVVGAIFFELVLNISGFANGTLGRFVLPILLIVAGAFFLVNGRRDRRGW